jgi:hypothetical protein
MSHTEGQPHAAMFHTPRIDAAQGSETIFKGMQDFAEGQIGEGPPLEDRDVYFQGDLGC